MTTHFLQLAEGTLAYHDEGEGPLILCMPAGGDLRSEYRFLTPQLVAAGYRVVTLDVRGQGESSAEWPDYTATALGRDMLAVIRHLGADSAVLIGASKAAAAAIWASVEAPELVRGLVLIGAYAHGPSWLQGRIIHPLLLAPLWGTALYCAYFPRLYPSSRPHDFDEHLAKVRAMLQEPGRLRALRRLFSDTGKDWEVRVPQVTAPVIILMGSRDPDMKDPVREAYRLEARLESAPVTVSIIDGAGHHLQTETPQQVAQNILDFLSEHTATIAAREYDGDTTSAPHA